MAKMTRVQKIAYYKEQIAKLEAEEAADAARNNIEVGDKVVFVWGRSENRVERPGEVVAIKDDPATGRWVKVTSGEGFDAEFFTVRQSGILSNASAEARKSEAAPAEPTPADPNDPLAAE
ncbi:hypothetical protein [Novosphingobium sp. LASN5T]|uniref:hypothetical protein n=1 Tax=Novosphingobium sp. LASN5T TaxID=2491021 RepID=UPI000F5FBB46|nr:hypothetical protein [Novosphingobium sp. LASN5T]RQW44677.1 hypothetical protein EH199_08060 [Novosphingobium sp. LASN5T]